MVIFEVIRDCKDFHELFALSIFRAIFTLVLRFEYWEGEQVLQDHNRRVLLAIRIGWSLWRSESDREYPCDEKEGERFHDG